MMTMLRETSFFVHKITRRRNKIAREILKYPTSQPVTQAAAVIFHKRV